MLANFLRHFRGQSTQKVNTRRNRHTRLKQKVSRSRPEQLEPRAMLAVDVLASIPDQFLAPNDAALKIDLTEVFDEPSIKGTVVSMAVNVPTGSETIYLELFDNPGEERVRTTPLTVDNFLSYVDTNRYDGSIIHRSVSGFVIQGGGYLAPTVPADQVGSNPKLITTGPTVLNEPGNSNVRGTISVAKVGGDPNSGNSQWFINTNDNLFLDDSTNNGGYTVFGRVLGTGMDLVDRMNATPKYDAAGYYGDAALSELPLWPEYDTSEGAPPVIIRPDDFLTLQVDRSAEVLYSVSTSNPSIVTVSMEGENLVLLPQGRAGTASVTVRATSAADPNAFVDQTFEVHLDNPLIDSLFSFNGTRWITATSDGVSLTSATFAQWNPSVTWSNPVVGDFNGDGRTDVAARTHYGQWWAAINQGDGTSVNWKGSWWGTNAGFTDIVVGDFNGDGKDDIAGRANSGAWIGAMASDGNTFTNKTLAIWDGKSEWDDVLTGDFNGDGKIDIAGRSQAGVWNVISNDANGNYVSSVAGSWTTKLTWNNVMPGDFNGDGRTDIVARGSNGLWYAAISLDRPNAVFSTSYMGAWSNTTWLDVRVGDFNGDGRADIIGRTQAGAWWTGVSRSDRLGFTNQFMGLWAPIQWAGVAVGDLNGDGRSDIVARVSTSQVSPLWVGLSLGGQFTTSKWGLLGAGNTPLASFVGKA